jgi:alpha-tubulin suppressor-like RCC1 family protein
VVSQPITWQLTVGAVHSCVTNLDGGLTRCWGYNHDHQINVALTTVEQPVSTTQLPPSPHAVAGGVRTCAWGGTIQACTGDNEAFATTLPDAGTSAFVLGGTSILAGDAEDFACTLGPVGDVWCWGYNDYAQAGVPVGGTTAPPTWLGLSGASELEAGPLTACALIDGGAFCWGSNGAGQATGDPNPSMVAPPAEVVGLPAVRSLTSGGTSSCGVTTDAHAWCWGGNGYGELGRPDDGGHAPGQVVGLDGVSAITSGIGHHCALLSDGGVRCWGENDWQQLGFDGGNTWQALEPVGLPIGAADVRAGERHTCAVLLNDEVWCWGDDNFGQRLCGNSGLPCRVLP